MDPIWQDVLVHGIAKINIYPHVGDVDCLRMCICNLLYLLPHNSPSLASLCCILSVPPSHMCSVSLTDFALGTLPRIYLLYYPDNRQIGTRDLLSLFYVRWYLDSDINFLPSFLLYVFVSMYRLKHFEFTDLLSYKLFVTYESLVPPLPVPDHINELEINFNFEIIAE